MIDIKILLNDPDSVRANIRKRFKNIDIDGLIDAVTRANKLKAEADDLRSGKKKLSREFSQAMSRKTGIEDIKKKIEETDARLTAIENESAELEKIKSDLLLRIPNFLSSDVPEGKTEDEKKIVFEGPALKEPGSPVKPHYEIGEERGIIDFKAAAEMSGSRFVILKNKLSALNRALITFMMNENGKNGYEEVYPPFLIKRDMLKYTGQVPDKEEDLYKIEGEDLYLIPTAEVSLVNYAAFLELKEEDLPKRMMGFTSCFRKEAGSYGKDIRGMMRVHQFDKVELVSISVPGKSPAEHEKMLSDASSLLTKLELPYRVALLCSADTVNTSSKTYDIEVYLPSQGTYREISSVSSCTDYQARRMNLKYRTADGGKALVHTLNGSALAVGRTLIAIMENYQNLDGSISVPAALVPYCGFDRI